MVGWIKQITTENDNVTHDFGYVAGFIVLMTSVAVIIFCGLMIMVRPAFDPQPFGIAVGAIWGAFAVALGALGAYRKLNQQP